MTPATLALATLLYCGCVDGYSGDAGCINALVYWHLWLCVLLYAVGAVSAGAVSAMYNRCSQITVRPGVLGLWLCM